MFSANGRRFALGALILAIVSPLLIDLSPSGSALDLDLYAELLARHTRQVSDTAGTRMDYAALRDSADWQRLILSLEQADPARLQTRAERLAFWINAYNILAIDTVIRSYPIESIRDVGSLFRPVWSRIAGRVGGRSVTLDEIEHEILRPMGEPRIHVAIVCASVSCPSLRREPWTAASIESQFADSMRQFLADHHKGISIDREERTIHLSMIFEWFEEDFEDHGGVLEFITPYLSEADRAWVSQQASNSKLEHMEYDWSLNDLALRDLASSQPSP